MPRPHMSILGKLENAHAMRAQVFVSVASFSCAQAEDGRCACKGLMDNVGGSLCVYQPEPGKKIPTSSPSRFLRAPFSGCECAPPTQCAR